MTFIRYVMIQLFAYVLDVGVFLLALHVGLFGPIISNLIGRVLAGAFAFLLHREFTFKYNDPADRLHQAIRYLILLSANVPLSSGILAFFLMFFEDVFIAKILSDVVGVSLTFWLSKSFVFVKKEKLFTSAVNLTDDNK